MTLSGAVFGGGFSDAPVESARVFRTAMSALARPGEIGVLGGVCPPAPMSMAAGALVLTLCDADTGLYLAGDMDTPEVRGWVTFHTGAPVVSAEQADFALGRWQALLPLAPYRIGTPEYPDQSVTLIAEVAVLEPSGAVLSGPGIRDSARLSVPDVAALRANAAGYPLGLDFFFTCGDRVAGLPRSTRVSEE